MKALTIIQPWATLIMFGLKRYETRNWPTVYRGPLIIHAAKGFPDWAQQMCLREPFASALKQCGIRTIWDRKQKTSDLPLGCGLGIVDMVDCQRMDQPLLHSLSAQELAFGEWCYGRYAWDFSIPLRWPTPIPMRGFQRLWDWPDTPVDQACEAIQSDFLGV